MAAVVTLAIAAVASVRLADHAGAKIGAALGDAVSAIPRRTAAPPLEPASPEASPLPIEEALQPLDPPRDSRADRGKRGDRARPVRGIRVRAPVVLRLAQRGARPSGVPVAAEGDRPCGIALAGVGGLGVGLQDGDILMDVGGQPARSVNAVIGAVTAAYRAVAPAVSGKIWRRGEVLSVVVEIPYPAEQR